MNTYRFAGFWVRLAATLIDSILLSIVSYLLIIIVTFSIRNNWALNIANLLGFLISTGYYIWYQQKSGQTIGKKLMNIRVVTYQGKIPSVFAFFLREIVGKFVSGIILGIGYLMVIWDKRKQGLHDKIANTYVIYVNTSKGSSPASSSATTEASAGEASAGEASATGKAA